MNKRKASRRLSLSQMVPDQNRAVIDALMQALSDDDKAAFLCMPQSGQRLATARFSVFSQREKSYHGENDSNAQAKMLGIDITGMYRMANQWMANHDLDSLGTGSASANPRKPKIDSEIRHRIEMEMIRLIEDDPNTKIKWLVESARSIGIKGIPGETTLRKWATVIKDDYSRKLFGNTVIIPLSTGLRNKESEDIVKIIVVFDAGTGLILSLSPLRRGLERDGMIKATRSGSQWLSENRNIPFHSVRSSATISADSHLLEECRDTDKPVILSIDSFRAWKNLAKHIPSWGGGIRLGRLRMARFGSSFSSGAETGEIVDLPIIDEDQLSWLLSHHLRSHNNFVIARSALKRSPVDTIKKSDEISALLDMIAEKLS